MKRRNTAASGMLPTQCQLVPKARDLPGIDAFQEIKKDLR
jgi:hypothetical protein